VIFTTVRKHLSRSVKDEFMEISVKYYWGCEYHQNQIWS